MVNTLYFVMVYDTRVNVQGSEIVRKHIAPWLGA